MGEREKVELRVQIYDFELLITAHRSTDTHKEKRGPLFELRHAETILSSTTYIDLIS